MSHIVVVGAGITGVTTAHALLQRGYRVTLVETHRYAAMETSFANGGQLSASNAEVWNSWATMLKGMRWMLRPGAPLLLNPWPSWHKYSWMAEFAAQIRHYRANTIETVRLAIEARRHLYAIAEEEGIEFDLQRRGILHLYYDEAHFRAAARTNELLRQGGLDRYPVTQDEVCKIEPSLACHDFYGGFFTPSDATGDIHKFTVGLAAACERRGAALRFGTAVSAIEARADGVTLRLEDGGAIEGDAVAICAGVASRRLGAMLGDRINIYPVKGYSITIPLADEAGRRAAPTVSLLDEDAKIVTSRLGDRLRVAGTAEFNGMNKDIRADRILPLVRWTERLFPAISTEQVIPWAGLRPMMPSMLPRVGRGRCTRVFYNTGHGHLGWTLAAATAQMVAETIAGALPAEALRPGSVTAMPAADLRAAAG